MHGGGHGGWRYQKVARLLHVVPGREMELLKQRSNGRVWDIETARDLMLTEPDWVAEKLQQVAATLA